MSNKKNILITGGSRGIGLSVAEEFAREGSTVAILARKEDELAVACERITKAGGKCIPVVNDVSHESVIGEVTDLIEGPLDGVVDVLVNTAGIYGPMGPLETNDLSKWKQTFEVNVFGTMHMCKAVLPYMKSKGEGVIVNFSGGGEGGFPNFSAYASSKGAILRLTETLAAEVREFGVTVNAIAPGAVNTALLEEVLEAGEKNVGKAFYENSLKQKDDGGVSPLHTASLIQFLVSDAGRLITGKFLSAIHDDRKQYVDHQREIMELDVYTVRRIKPKDRGYDW